uniref:Uncharacterized protein n=1 Tax=Photinus pyralis TaxID=7054 RepID=A0A1Y1MG59_PHOPY
MSMRSSNTDNKPSSSDKIRYDRQSSDSATRTVQRRATMESSPIRYQSRFKTENKPDSVDNLDETKPAKSFLPRKSLGDFRLRASTPSDLVSSEKVREDHSEASRLCKYLSPSNYYENVSRSQTPSLDTERSRSEHSQPTRKPSRFLRPDFYDNKDANYFLKEKKERELETQKVLKEIRDRRRFRDQSLSSEVNGQSEEDKSISASTDEILKNVSDNIKKIENNVQQEMHDYVNLPVKSVEKIPEYVNVNSNEVVKKPSTSKISRPKSYPAETHEHKKINLEDSRIFVP